MNKDVTVNALEELIVKFNKYKETAEQHEFPKLYALDKAIEKTDLKIICSTQSQARAMFRTIAKTIGEDYSNYMEANMKTVKIIGPCSKYIDGQGWVTEVPISLLESLGFYKKELL
jgi:hypothetical protein